MDIPAHIAMFWRAFVRSRAEDPTPRFYEAFHFDDHESSANELAQLVLRGTKRATAGLVWVFEHERKPLPRVGDLNVVTNWAYFGRECKRIGRTPDVRMLVTCERFAVVYRGGDDGS